MQLIDLTGIRFGRLIVLERSTQDDKNGHARWICQCECGNMCVKDGYALRIGKTKSCGCLMSEHQMSQKTSGSFAFKHGLVYHRIYSIWRGMIDRCERPKNKAYNYYGGRGIRVCDEWRQSVEAFAEWAFQSGYQENLTIDRIDVNGDYCPENCRWATLKEQSRNRRNIRPLTYQGVTRPLWEWAEITGISVTLLSSRMSKGWPAERIFNEPVHTECRNHRTKSE